MKTVLTLPFPVSVNAMYADGATRRVKSQKYHEWCVEAGWELKRQRPTPIKGQVMLTYEVKLVNDNRRRDVGNFEKGITDLLVTHGIIEEDDQRFVQEIRLRWNPDVEGVRVTIQDYASTAFKESAA